MLHKQTAINPRAVLSEAAKSRTLHGTERDKEIQSLASFVNDTVRSPISQIPDFSHFFHSLSFL
jgi:hypothetical protein